MELGTESEVSQPPSKLPVRNTVIGSVVGDDKTQIARQFRKQSTPAERRLWQCLRANRLAGLHFRRQQVIAGFVVDFYCHSAAVIVEVDGPIHQTQFESDRERDAVLGALGFQLLRFTNEAVFRELPQVLAVIEQACRV